MRWLVLLLGVALLAVALAWPRGHAQPVTVSPSAQAVAAATFDALMQLDCDQSDTQASNCSDELQAVNVAPTVLSTRRTPRGLWRIVLQFHLTGGPGTVQIPETVG